MTRPYEPPGEFAADNGAILRYSKRDDGGVQISILNECHDLLAGWALTPDQLMELFYELDFCGECGEPIGEDGCARHAAGR